MSTFAKRFLGSVGVAFALVAGSAGVAVADTGGDSPTPTTSTVPTPPMQPGPDGIYHFTLASKVQLASNDIYKKDGKCYQSLITGGGPMPMIVTNEVPCPPGL